MMGSKISNFLSYVLHPLLMPTYTFGLVFFLLPRAVTSPLTVSMLPFLFFTTFIIPSISIYVLKISGTIKGMTMLDRKERIIPFLYVSLFYFMTAYMFIFKIGVNQVITWMLVSTCLLIVILTLITIKFKISIHSAGLSGVVGFLLAFSLYHPNVEMVYAFIIMLLLSGSVMTARLRLNAHHPKEVLLGTLVGFSVNFFGVFWLF